jgi:hypothetical protein
MYIDKSLLIVDSSHHHLVFCHLLCHHWEGFHHLGLANSNYHLVVVQLVARLIIAVELLRQVIPE